MNRLVRPWRLWNLMPKLRRPEGTTIYSVGVLVMLVALLIPFLTRQHSEWETVFVKSAAYLLSGRDFYVEPIAYTYPPLQTFLAVPFVGLTPTASRAVWFLINAIAMILTLRAAWSLAGGTHRNLNRREHFAMIVGSIVGLVYSIHTLAHQQTDLVLAALVIGGGWLLARERGYSAAVLFGIAAAMKCTPLLFAPYLLIKGRPGAAAVVLLVAVGTSFLPDLLGSPTQHSTWLAEWFAMYLRPMIEPHYAPGVWASEIIYNQSMIGAVNRWSGTTWGTLEQKIVLNPRDIAIAPTTLKKLLLGVMLAMTAVGVWIIKPWRKFDAATHAARLPWELSLVLATMLLWSPMSSVPHFVVLALPGYLLARGVIVSRRYELVPFLLILVGSTLASNKDLVGSECYTMVLWYGGIMLGAVAVWVGAAVGIGGRVWKPTPAAPIN